MLNNLKKVYFPRRAKIVAISLHTKFHLPSPAFRCHKKRMFSANICSAAVLLHIIL